MLPGLRGETVKAVRLPRIGEVVYQGLPLAALSVAGKPLAVIRAPVSGVVAGVNDALADEPALVTGDPCGRGWIACLCTTQFEEEVVSCQPRRVLLVNADERSTVGQRERLRSLGCRVRTAKGRDELIAALGGSDCRALLIDAASCGEDGPELVAEVNARSPALKIVVVASARDQWESNYRGHHIFYYAVEPFGDNEIADILDAAFRPPEPHPAKADRAAGAEAVGSISITNRNGHKVQLLSAPGLLRRREGLGCQIGSKLLAGLFPLVMTPGEASITPAARAQGGRGLRSRDGADGQGRRSVARQPGAGHEGRVRPALGRERGPRHDPGRAAGRGRRVERLGRADHGRPGGSHCPGNGVVLKTGNPAEPGEGHP